MTRVQRIVGDPAPAPSARWLAPSLIAASLAGAIALTAVACGGAASKTESTPEPATASETKASAISIAWLPEGVRRWTPYFVDAAQRHGVDPEMLAIVTLVESLGDPDARSPIGATGLMQIMPGTAAKIAQEGGFASPNADKLRDPAYNIELGAFYLKRQLDSFGSVEMAAAAYNGGEKQLRAHLDKGAPLSDETDHYKSLIRALWEQRHDPHSTAFEAFEARVHRAQP